MDVTFDIINKYHQECWSYYKNYYKEFKEENYSDIQPQDFLDWCEENLWYCKNCETIVLKDDQTRLYDHLNPDNVCDGCIEIGGYYD